MTAPSFPGFLAIGEIEDIPTRLALQTIEDWARRIRWNTNEELLVAPPTLERVELNSTFVTTYDDDPTEAASQAIATASKRRMTFITELSKTLAPTSIIFKMQVSEDASDWHDPTDADLSVTVTAANIPGFYYMTATVSSTWIRIYAVANGTDAANKITVESAVVMLGD